MAALSLGAAAVLVAKRLAQGTAVAGGGGAAWLLADDRRRKQTRRTLAFYRTMVPIYAHYRWTEWRVNGKPEDERDAAFDALHDLYAPKMFDLISSLRGLYVKLGQIGATRADFVPERYIEEFSRLQDGVPPEDFSVIRGIIEGELKCPIEDVFEWVDPKPLGAASIGQAHAARLKNGDDVVVKVQYPHVKHHFALDFATVRSFARFAQPEFNEIWDEMEQQFMTEFSFEREAAMQKRIAANLLPYYGDRIYIAKVYDDLVTPNVLVMDRIEGPKLVDGMKAQLTAIAESQGMTLEQMRKQYATKPKNADGTGDATPPMRMPSPWVVRSYLWYIRVRQYVRNAGIFLYNITLGWFRGALPYTRPVPVLHASRIMTTLAQVNGHAVLVDGLFNADQHPGNILLMPDGRLGLIDFGQVKEIDELRRYQIARLMLALARDDRAAIVEECKRQGFRTKRMDPEAIYLHAVSNFDRDTRDVTGERNLQQFIEYLNELDPIETLPTHLIMPARCAILMRGVGTLLAYPISVAKLWQPMADRVVKDYAVQHAEAAVR